MRKAPAGGGIGTQSAEKPLGAELDSASFLRLTMLAFPIHADKERADHQPSALFRKHPRLNAAPVAEVHTFPVAGVADE